MPEGGGMSVHRDREVEELANSYVAGAMSRRVFIFRLLALGLSTSAAGAILAACASTSSPSPASQAPSAGSAGPGGSPSSSGVPTGLKGTIRFLIGPWTDQEVQHHQVIQSAFNALNPDVQFTYKLFDWATSTTEIGTSLESGAHDIFYIEDHDWIAFSDRLEDLTPRINDPAFAAEKGKYLYLDRLAQYGSKLIGMPNNWAVVDMLYTNMDMVRAAGYDEHFVDTWDSLVACTTKMTKGTDTYGLGIGIQLGPTFGEWYEWLRGAGGSYLNADQKSTNINLPAVVDITKLIASLYKQGVAPPIGTYNYDTGPDAFVAGKIATYSSDMAPAPGIQAKKPSFEWKLLPYPPGSATRQNMFSIVGTYAMSPETPDKDLAWEVLKFWTNAEHNAYWTDVSGPYPARSDALQHGYPKEAAPQLAEVFDVMHDYAMGAEPFAKWGECETAAEQQIGNAWTGQETPEAAVANVDAAVKKIALT
jgi:ABC-type glycerol-3-phosphate transport system substrate-binding protein